MDIMLREVQKASLYIDDTLASGKDIEDHLSTLRGVLDKMREFNFRLSKDTCEIMKQSVEFLGHKISAAGIETTRAKVNDIINMTVPCDMTSLRSFLGLVNFYGKYLKNLADVSEPLYRLTYKIQRGNGVPNVNLHLI